MILLLFFYTAITCFPVTAQTNGAVEYNTLPNSGGRFVFQTVATFSCLPGFGLVGPSSSSCEDDVDSLPGVFSPAPPTCEREFSLC